MRACSSYGVRSVSVRQPDSPAIEHDGGDDRTGRSWPWTVVVVVGVAVVVAAAERPPSSSLSLSSLSSEERRATHAVGNATSMRRSLLASGQEDNSICGCVRKQG